MTRFQIEAPVRSFTGEVAEVAFKNGTGFVEDTDKPGRAALEYFRRQHYGVAPAPDKDVATAVMDLVTGGGAFDPVAHSVAEVTAYLDDADAAEALRVLDAEAAGKDRAGITKQREAILASKTEAPAADDQIGATE